MISFMLQGFAMLLAAFLIGLPLGDCLAGLLRRWHGRVTTDRVLGIAAVRPPSRPASETEVSAPVQDDILPWSEAAVYPAEATVKRSPRPPA